MPNNTVPLANRLRDSILVVAKPNNLTGLEEVAFMCQKASTSGTTCKKGDSGVQIFVNFIAQTTYFLVASGSIGGQYVLNIMPITSVREIASTATQTVTGSTAGLPDWV